MQLEPWRMAWPLAVCLGLIAGAQSPAPVAGTSVITGHVLDGTTGQPVAAATVLLQPQRPVAGADVPRVLTDAEGRYFFDRVSKGTYQVTATKPGWINGAYGKRRFDGDGVPLVVDGAAHRPGTDVPIWRFATLDGYVTDDLGEPAVDVVVRMLRRQIVAGVARMTIVSQIRTDDRGYYRFTNLQPGEYTTGVIATVASKPPTYTSAAKAAGQAEPPGYLQSLVSIRTAPVIEFNEVRVTTRDGGVVSSPIGMTGPPDGDTWTTFATAFHPSATAVTAATSVRVAAGEHRPNVNIAVRLVPVQTVRGIVTGPEGPAASTAVHLVAAETGDAPIFDTAMAVTDAGGAFTMFGVPEGSYFARVVRVPPPPPGRRLAQAIFADDSMRVAMVSSGPGAGFAPPQPEPLLFGEAPVVVTDRAMQGVAIQMRAAPRARGRVEFDGASSRPTQEQLTSIRVDLEATTGLAPELSAMSPGQFTPDGQFLSQSLPAGQYFLRVGNLPAGWFLRSVLYDGRDISESPVDLRTDIANVVVTLTDHPARITGTVTEAPDGAAVSVLLFPASRDEWTLYGRTTRRVVATRVDAAGAFSLLPPPPGDYLMIAVVDDDAVGWQDPARLAALAADAERVRVRDGEPLTQNLRVRRIR